MFFKKLIVFGALTTLVFSSINAANCGPSGKSVRILGSDFPAIHAVAGTAKDNCAGNANVFTVTHKDDTRQIMNAALTPNPAEYTSVIVANSTLTQLMNDGLVRPLNDLVKKYGSHLKPHQMITIDGDVMAVAFMANSQHLFTRKDILSAAGVQGTPASIEEVLDAAKKIRAAGIMEYPIVTNLKVGWNVGEVFNLFYMAQGGQHFKSGSAEPNIKALKSIRAKTILMPCNQDLYFRTEDNKFEKKFISRSSLRPVDSPYGHCAANPGNDKNFESHLDKNISELLTN